MEDATLIQMQGYFSKWISLAGGGRSTGPGWERGLTVVGLDHQPLGLITVPQETHNSWKVLGPLQAVLSMQTARVPKRRVRQQRLGLVLKGTTAGGSSGRPMVKMEGQVSERVWRGQDKIISVCFSLRFSFSTFPLKCPSQPALRKTKQ